MALQCSGAAPAVEGPAEDGSAMEAASAKKTAESQQKNKKKTQRMALQWQKDPQRMALQCSGAAPAVEGPAEDGSAMEAASAKKNPLRVSKKKKPQRMALQWQKDPQRMALQCSGAAPAVEGSAEDGSAMEAA